MTKLNNDNTLNEESLFTRRVRAQAARKLKARARPSDSLWLGLGMSGLVGWTVAVPTLVGTAFGIWVDNRYPSSYSWTLMLMFTGLIIGCLNAWHWIDQENAKIQEN